MKRCTTCGRNTREFAEFPCPSCSNSIIRCQSCRLNRNTYTCSCGLVGP